MKQRLSILLVGILLLVACGQPQAQLEPQVSPVPTSPNAAADPSTPETEASPPAEQMQPANEEITTAPETITITPSAERTPDQAAAPGVGEATTPVGEQPAKQGAIAGGTASGEWDCGDTSRLEGELNIFSWADYWPEDLLQEFEDACGVHVTLSTYPSNEDLAARLRAGNSGFDLVLPSDYMVDILAREDLLLELDKTQIPNIANLDPNQMGMYYDPDNTYSLPFQYGLTGIAYDSTAVTTPPDSWAALFDPAQLEQVSNRVSMLDDERESIGAALKYHGFSVNSTDQGELEQATQSLLEQKPFLARYDSENVSAGLASGEIVMAHAWNGAASLAREENPNIEWTMPEEGGVIWVDTMAIPNDAPHPYAAHVLINNVLDGQISARLIDYSYYLAPNVAAEQFISEDVRALLFLPDDAMQERLEYLERQSDPAIYADIWTRVKSQ